jgi:ABC-type sugar transport system substrate-binding protein
VHLVGVLAVAIFGLTNTKSWLAVKVVGATLFSFQNRYVVTLGEAMKLEAARQGIDLVSLDSGGNVMMELYQVEKLISQKVDLIVMNPVDQKTRHRSHVGRWQNSGGRDRRAAVNDPIQACHQRERFLV